MSRLEEYEEYSYFMRGGISLGGAFTGAVVAVTSTAFLTVWGAALLDAQGFDLHKALRGSFTWASAGISIAFVTALFLSFLWGGYTAGRMGAGAGVINGLMVAVFTLVVLALSTYITLEVMALESLDLPIGIGKLPLDGNFTVAGFIALGAMGLALVGGAIWGGVNGERWHLREEVQLEDSRWRLTGTDSFSDLRR